MWPESVFDAVRQAYRDAAGHGTERGTPQKANNLETSDKTPITRNSKTPAISTGFRAGNLRQSDKHKRSAHHSLLSPKSPSRKLGSTGTFVSTFSGWFKPQNWTPLRSHEIPGQFPGNETWPNVEDSLEKPIPASDGPINSEQPPRKRRRRSADSGNDVLEFPNDGKDRDGSHKQHNSDVEASENPQNSVVTAAAPTEPSVEFIRAIQRLETRMAQTETATDAVKAEVLRLSRETSDNISSIVDTLQLLRSQLNTIESQLVSRLGDEATNGDIQIVEPLNELQKEPEEEIRNTNGKEISENSRINPKRRELSETRKTQLAGLHNNSVRKRKHRGSDNTGISEEAEEAEEAEPEIEQTPTKRPTTRKNNHKLTISTPELKKGKSKNNSDFLAAPHLPPPTNSKHKSESTKTENPEFVQTTETVESSDDPPVDKPTLIDLIQLYYDEVKKILHGIEDDEVTFYFLELEKLLVSVQRIREPQNPESEDNSEAVSAYFRRCEEILQRLYSVSSEISQLCVRKGRLDGSFSGNQDGKSEGKMGKTKVNELKKDYKSSTGRNLQTTNHRSGRSVVSREDRGGRVSFVFNTDNLPAFEVRNESAEPQEQPIRDKWQVMDATIEGSLTMSPVKLDLRALSRRM